MNGDVPGSIRGLDVRSWDLRVAWDAADWIESEVLYNRRGSVLVGGMKRESGCTMENWSRIGAELEDEMRR